MSILLKDRGREQDKVSWLLLSKRFMNPASFLVALTVLNLVFISSAPVYCETKKVSVAVVCLEFPDISHRNSLDEIRKKVIDDVDRFYKEVSYGKLSITGEVFGWYMMPVPSINFNVGQWGAPSEDRNRLVNMALQVAQQNTLNASSYKYKVLVYSSDVVGFAISNLGVTSQGETSDWRTFAHELTHLLGLPDLYSYEKAAEYEFSSVFAGSWDIMSNSQSQLMCAWSRIKMGWIEPSQLVIFRGSLLHDSVILSLLELGQGILAMRLETYVWYGQPYYFVEVHQDMRVASERRILYGGVLVTYIDETKKGGEGIVSVIDAHPSSSNDITYELFDACFDLWGEGKVPVCFIPGQSVAIVLLSKTGSSYKIGLMTEQEGKQALEAHNAIRVANSSIQKAKDEFRVEGLDKAKNTLDLAVLRYAEEQFKDSIQLAGASKALADEATIPKIYYEVKQGIETTNNKLNQALLRKFGSAQAAAKPVEAAKALDDAKKALKATEFELALTYLGKCNDLLSEAEQIENAYTQAERNLLIGISVAISLLALSIIFLRRRRRRPASPLQPPEANHVKHTAKSTPYSETRQTKVNSNP